MTVMAQEIEKGCRVASPVGTAGETGDASLTQD